MRTERTRDEMISDVVKGGIAGAVVGFLLLLVAMGVAGIEGAEPGSEGADFRLIKDVFLVIFAAAGALAGLIRSWLATWWGRVYQVFIITLAVYGSISIGMNDPFTGSLLLDGVVIAAVVTPIWLLTMRLTPFGREFAADLDSLADRDYDPFDEQLKKVNKRKRQTRDRAGRNKLTMGWSVAGSTFLIWALSDFIFGVANPWEAPFGYFILLSFGVGLYFGYRSWPLWLVATGAITGQALALLILPEVDRTWLGSGIAWAGISCIALLAGYSQWRLILRRPVDTRAGKS